MLALRKTSSNEINEAYVYFCERFLKHVVGVSRFNREYRNGNGIVSIATVSDEALALIQLENSENRWTTEFSKRENGQDVGQKDLPQPLYTSGGQNKVEQKGFTKKHGGWTEEGIIRFNKLCNLISEDRKKHGAWFDSVLKERKTVSNAEFEEENASKFAREVVTAYDDMVYPTILPGSPQRGRWEDSDFEEDENGSVDEVGQRAGV
jgi:hypothetical protein